MNKVLPIYRGIYGSREFENTDYFMVTVEVIAKYPPITSSEATATVER